ncbi:hypothetical protein D9M71_602290 [compost metagenome]
MIEKLISAALSTTLACLLYVGGFWSQFAFYAIATFSVIGCMSVLFCDLTEEQLAKMRAYWWISTPSSAFSIGSLVYNGYPGWAAFSLIVTLFIVAKVFKK